MFVFFIFLLHILLPLFHSNSCEGKSLICILPIRFHLVFSTKIDTMKMLVLDVYCCGKHHDQEQQGEQGFASSYPSRLQCIHRKSQQEPKPGRNLKARTKAEAMGGAAQWLAAVPCSATCGLLRSSTAHKGLGPPTMIINMGKSI